MANTYRTYISGFISILILNHLTDESMTLAHMQTSDQDLNFRQCVGDAD